MAKLKLQPDPTFKAKVGIHRAGAKSDEVEFVFRYRNEDARDELIASFQDETQWIDIAMQVVSGWDLEDAFTKENVLLLAKNYAGLPNKDGTHRPLLVALYHRYLEELSGARLGN